MSVTVGSIKEIFGEPDTHGACPAAKGRDYFVQISCRNSIDCNRVLVRRIVGEISVVLVVPQGAEMCEECKEVAGYGFSVFFHNFYDGLQGYFYRTTVSQVKKLAKLTPEFQRFEEALSEYRLGLV